MEFEVLVFSIIFVRVISRRNTFTVKAILHLLILFLFDLSIILAVNFEKFFLGELNPLFEPILIFFGASNLFLDDKVEVEATFESYFNKKVFPVALE